jgi:septal ring factor EnvC (AmiA/AmiB activator)
MALNVTQDTAKYKKHLKNSLESITNSAVEATDHLVDAREKLRRHVERRAQRAEGGEDEDGNGEGKKTEAEVKAEQRAAMLEERVPGLTVESEKALREIIDYADELARQGGVLEGVVRRAAEASLRANEARRQRQRQRHQAENSDDEDAEEDVDADGDVEMMDPEVAILSPLELLKAAKEEDEAAYEARTMRSRYALRLLARVSIIYNHNGPEN